jgi:plasmid stabilization system protein ParE
MKPVHFHPDAQSELDAAIAYYEERSPGLGIDLRKLAESATRKIQAHPLRWSPHDQNTRRFLIRRFPYSLIYFEMADQLWIVAVAHHKRRPGYWRNRR